MELKVNNPSKKGQIKYKELKIPVIYNTSSYEKVDSLKLLDGLIDIYLPDLKYAENELAKKYSKVNNYFDVANRVAGIFEK